MTASRDRIAERDATPRPWPGTRGGPRVTSLEEAAYWLGVHHGYAIQDADRLDRVEDRLRRLERRRWWHLWAPRRVYTTSNPARFDELKRRVLEQVAELDSLSEAWRSRV